MKEAGHVLRGRLRDIRVRSPVRRVELVETSLRQSRLPRDESTGLSNVLELLLARALATLDKVPHLLAACEVDSPSDGHSLALATTELELKGQKLAATSQLYMQKSVPLEDVRSVFDVEECCDIRRQFLGLESRRSRTSGREWP